MFHVDGKLIMVGALFLALVVVKLVAGGRPYDKPVRRRRRFGHRGSEGPLHGLPRLRSVAEAGRVEPPPVDPEEEFFKGT